MKQVVKDIVFVSLLEKVSPLHTEQNDRSLFRECRCVSNRSLTMYICTYWKLSNLVDHLLYLDSVGRSLTTSYPRCVDLGKFR